MKTVQWNKVKEFEEIIYEKHNGIAKVTINRLEKRNAFTPIKINEIIKNIYKKQNGIAKVTINRPEKRNAFTPLTVNEMIEAFSDARDDSQIGVIILTGQGEKAFCSGGDQSVRGHGGYVGTDEV